MCDSPNKQKGRTTQSFNCNILIEFQPGSLGSTKKEKLNIFSACYLKANSDIKELFHQGTCVCLCVYLYTSIITDTKFYLRK